MSSLCSRLQAGGLDLSDEQELQALRLGQKSNSFLLRDRVHLVAESPWNHSAFFPLQYVVVSSKKILFYNSESDREQANPFMTLDIE